MSRRAPLVILAAAGAVVAGAADAQPAATTYPKSRALTDVSAWIGADTPLQLAQVVDVGPAAITAVISAVPTGDPRGFIAHIAAEAVDPAIAQQENILSWTMPVEIDCEKRVVRLGDMTGYPGRDLASSGRIVRTADTAWVTPAAAAPLGVVIRALCDRDYKRPFASPGKVAAAKPGRSPPPGPPPQVVNLQPPTTRRPMSEAAAKGAAPGAEGPGRAPRSKTAEANPAQAKTAQADPPPAETSLDKSPAAKPKAPRPIGHGASPYIVQVGASPSLEDAKAVLARLQKRFPSQMAGLKAEAVNATVDGKAVYRAQVSGFAGGPDANSLCEQFKAGGQACFVRR